MGHPPGLIQYSFVNEASASHLQANEFEVLYGVDCINLSNYFSPEKALADFS